MSDPYTVTRDRPLSNGRGRRREGSPCLASTSEGQENDATTQDMNQRLTKRVFLNLPTGMHLASNTMRSIGVPVFAEAVAHPSERRSQWRRIVAARANGRHFFLFPTADGYKRMVQRMGYGQELSATNN
jgi:hypothetical protein